MSRCFSFPPPDYTLSTAQSETMIELIKLYEKKQRRREKRQKRKEEKEKKDETNQNLDMSEFVKDLLIGQTTCSDTKDEFLHERSSEVETEEQLAKSNLTEELGNPVSLPVLPSSSSESTENSKKRKRPSSPVDDAHSLGKAILIRQLSKEQNEFDALAKEQQQLPTTSGRTEFPLQNKNDTDQIDRLMNFSLLSPSRQIEGCAPGRMPLKYKDMILNWVPLPVQHAYHYPENLDWLFQDRNQEIRAEKRQRTGTESSSCSKRSAMWPPRGQYLHEIHAYALPFTVPL